MRYLIKDMDSERQAIHYNVTLWRVRVMFIPPRLASQHNTIALFEYTSPAAEVENVAMEGHKRFLCTVELCICQQAKRPRCQGNATMRSL